VRSSNEAERPRHGFGLEFAFGRPRADPRERCGTAHTPQAPLTRRRIAVERQLSLSRHGGLRLASLGHAHGLDGQAVVRTRSALDLMALRSLGAVARRLVSCRVLMSRRPNRLVTRWRLRDVREGFRNRCRARVSAVGGQADDVPRLRTADRTRRSVTGLDRLEFRMSTARFVRRILLRLRRRPPVVEDSLPTQHLIGVVRCDLADVLEPPLAGGRSAVRLG
jgi:hypothetical protein